MRHKEESIVVKECTLRLAVEDNPRALLIQPVDGHDVEELPNLIGWVEAHTQLERRTYAMVSAPCLW